MRQAQFQTESSEQTPSEVICSKENRPIELILASEDLFPCLGFNRLAMHQKGHEVLLAPILLCCITPQAVLKRFSREKAEDMLSIHGSQELNRVACLVPEPPCGAGKGHDRF